MSGSLTTSRTAAGWRLVKTRHGDTLQEIAARELGDANRWPELASLNDLIPPFLTGDADEATGSLGRVKLYGSSIRVFAPSAIVDADTDPAGVYGTDILLRDGMLLIEDGDFALTSGLDNLRAALRRRIEVQRGELLFHGQYGSEIRRLLGRGNAPATTALAGRAARLAIEQDDRVQRIVQVQASSSGDGLFVDLELIPIQSAAVLSVAAEV